MGKSGMIEADGKKLFLNVYAPTARLVIIGAVHISQALAPLARSLDYDVYVVDPRTAFASPERFPDKKPLSADLSDVALPPLNIDHYTAFVALHLNDPEDSLIRRCCTPSSATYVFIDRFCGSYESDLRQDRRAAGARKCVATDADTAKIHAPIGRPNISSVPLTSEIAVAIVSVGNQRDIACAPKRISGARKRHEIRPQKAPAMRPAASPSTPCGRDRWC